MIKNLLLIGLGGALGSILRYLSQVGIYQIAPLAFPLGTFVVNITGCFLIGLFYGIFERYAGMSQGLSLFLITGLCGGFTTFSSYSYEGLSLLREGDYFYFSMYVGLSVVLGLMATFVGIWLVK